MYVVCRFCMFLFKFLNYALLLLCLCIVIVIYFLISMLCFHRANWHSSVTLIEGFPCFFFSCKANARAYLAKTGTASTFPTSDRSGFESQIAFQPKLLIVLFCVLFVCKCVLYCCSVHCLCVNVYCTAVLCTVCV